MNRTKTMLITEVEAWAIDDLIRHTWTEDGRPVGRELLLKIFSVIKEFQARSGRPFPPKEIPLALSEDEGWAVDYHIRRGYADPSGIRIGKDLLLKAFGLLLEFANERELGRAGVGEGLVEEPDLSQRLDAFRRYFKSDDDPSPGEGSEPRP